MTANTSDGKAKPGPPRKRVRRSLPIHLGLNIIGNARDAVDESFNRYLHAVGAT